MFLKIANFAGIQLIVGQPGVNLLQVVILGEDVGIAFYLTPVNGVFVVCIMIEAAGGCFDFLDYYRIGIQVDSIDPAANG